MKNHRTLTIWEAIEVVCDHSPLMEEITVPIMDSLGYILAEDVHTRIAQPPFPRSAMDGYAIRSGDSAGASRQLPCTLKVVGIQFAGDPYFRELKKGEALRIMTGAAIPEGADAVIKQEDTDYGEDLVEIYRQMSPFDNYCQIGEDFPAGETLAVKGDYIDAFLISAAAAGGIESFRVRRHPRVAILTTGDEIQDPGTGLKEGKIYDAHIPLFSNRLKQLGCQVSLAKHLGDDRETIKEALKEAASVSDVIITTGGVSVGLKDCIPSVMDDLRAGVVFHGIAIKPGMPTMFSIFEGRPVLSLSGNPYSASAVFELLMQPMICHMTASNKRILTKVRGRAENAFPKNSGNTRFLRGYYEDGCLSFGSGQRNGQTKAGIGCNCLICLEKGSDPVDIGDMLTAYLI